MTTTVSLFTGGVIASPSCQVRADRKSPSTVNSGTVACIPHKWRGLACERAVYQCPISDCHPKQSARKIKDRNCAVASASSQLTAMEKEVDFKKLQNGSDIRGVSVDGVPGEPVNLTEDVTEAIAAAYVAFLAAKKKTNGTGRLRISIGHDSRVSAQSLMDAATRGITGAGAEVVQFGLASTPAMFNSTITNSADLFCPADGAIMLTASHLPYNRNGLKFFTNEGGASKKDITDILARAASYYAELAPEVKAANAAAAASGLTKTADYMKRYCEDLVEAVRKGANGVERPLEGFHIVVDAGNGAGGFFSGGVLEPLGANTAGSQFLEPDGLFPNHIPNPEDKKAMEAITKAVLHNKADFGIIFDTDVDRAAAVDSNGVELNRNRLIALEAAIVLSEHPGTTVVTDSVTSDGLTEFIEKKLGGKHLRFKRGYKNVIDEGIRLNTVGEGCHLAIETSGHGALRENRWLDDGAFLMVKLLIRMAAAATAGEGKDSTVLTKLIEDLQEAEESAEVRFKIDQSHAEIGPGGFREYGERVLARLESEVAANPDLTKAPVNYEGVRVSGYGGWFLLRLSLHDPVLPLNIEGPSKEATKKLGLAVHDIVKEFPALDISSLEKYLSS
eukprot:TRINITY_DN19285_c0_g1_i1.p1 TRINITY_DN19285_c0_g1~~TRINITY_DN19285_c0_g1_i1.p1  ORF type:complete len:618 (-),score=139.78 TRINITY_DN19285_c0_g1_i1:690-2543(-)